MCNSAGYDDRMTAESGSDVEPSRSGLATGLELYKAGAVICALAAHMPK